MQDKFIDTADQLIADLFAADADEAQDIADTAASLPAIQIVHFDESDQPAEIETRPLHSFL